MANRPAPALALRDGDREKLESWLRSRSVRSGLVKRAPMILLAADGVGNRPRELDHAAIVTTATLTPPPKKLGVTHWSTRLLAGQLKIGNTTIARAWQAYGIKP